MTEQELAAVLASHTSDEIGTHWDGCHHLHPRCAVHKLVAEGGE